MRFAVATDGIDLGQQRPVVVLRRDNWDDYTYKTSFYVSLHLPTGEQRDLDNVKIVRQDQRGGYTDMPTGVFTRLDDTYCSLGQAFSYYERLLKLGEEIYVPFLRGLRDMVFLPEVQTSFRSHAGVMASLLRFDTAVSALEEAPKLFDGANRGSDESVLRFSYTLPQSDTEVEFRFGEVPELPSRIVVVIGYNGAGKTRLLAKLAMLACADWREIDSPGFRAENGSYVGTPPVFGSIVAISYSAFDDFNVPGVGRSANAALERERAGEGKASDRNYTYCGLRQVDSAGGLLTALKSIEQLTTDFHRARRRALEKARVETLEAAMAPLADEPSFRLTAELPDVNGPDALWESTFARFSTGHKIVLNIVVQLCANLERRSLVLIDEPEMHLHPPLLAALLRAIGIVLARHDSFSIVATHSPVVLQEVPRRSVKVLERVLDGVAFGQPELETFGENVGILTKYAFHLDSSDTDYEGILRELARERTLVEIEALFGGDLSSQARSLVMAMQRAESWPE